jgi:hypothetical protein
MKREQLRRRLALASLEILGPNRKKTVPNVQRYVIPHLNHYQIRKSDTITLSDILTALMILEYICSQKPIAFRYGMGQAFQTARKDAFMNTSLPVE